MVTEETQEKLIQCPQCRVKTPRPRLAMTATCSHCGKSVALDDRAFNQHYVFGGEVLTRGKISVGQSGTVKANLSGTDVTIEGSVNGNVTAVERLILGRTANLHGDATAETLVIAEGAVLQGYLEIGKTDPG